MNTLNPLSFPEDTQQRKPASAFPYAPVGSPPPAPQQAEENTRNRMQQLESMLQEVQGRAEIIEKEAYDKAYLAGEKAGMALGKKRAEQILDTLQDTLKEAELSLGSIQQSCAEAAMDIAGFIARKIVSDAIQTDSTRLWDIAKQAAAQLPESAELRIAVSPDDFFTFKRLLDDDDAMLVLNSDAGVESGTCRIISSQQDILIDPVSAVNGYLEALRPELLKPEQGPIPDAPDGH